MDVVYATGTFFVEGVGRIDGGTIWAADDPVVKRHPHAFTDDPAASPGFCRSAGAPVEQATSAPGEKRATRRA